MAKKPSEYEVEYEYQHSVIGIMPFCRSHVGALNSIARNIKKMAKDGYGNDLVNVRIVEHKRG